MKEQRNSCDWGGPTKSNQHEKALAKTSVQMGRGEGRDGEAQNATTATPTEQDRSSRTQSTHGTDLSASKNETTQRRGRGQCSLPGSEKAPSLNQPPRMEGPQGSPYTKRCARRTSEAETSPRPITTSLLSGAFRRPQGSLRSSKGQEQGRRRTRPLGTPPMARGARENPSFKLRVCPAMSWKSLAACSLPTLPQLLQAGEPDVQLIPILMLSLTVLEGHKIDPNVVVFCKNFSTFPEVPSPPPCSPSRCQAGQGIPALLCSIESLSSASRSEAVSEFDGSRLARAGVTMTAPRRCSSSSSSCFS